MKNGFYLLAVMMLCTLHVSQAQDIRKGKWYLFQEQYKRAWNIFDSLVTKDPSDARADFYLGQICFLNGKPDSADYYYKKGLAANKEEPLNYIGIGKILLNKGDTSGALGHFEEGKKLARDNAGYYNEVAEACLASRVKDFETAMTYLDKSADISPNNPGYFIALGDYDQLKKTLGEAANEYENAIYYDKKNIEAYLKLGKLYIGARDYRDAIATFNSTIACDSSQIIAYKYLGDIYYKNAQYKLAKQYYDIYISRAEYNPLDEEEYAFILFFNKDYMKAKTLLDDVIKVYPDMPLLYRLRAYLDYETGDYARGLQDMQTFFNTRDTLKALALDYVYYGRLLILNDHDSAGAVALKKAIELDSTQHDLYNEIARIDSKTGRHIDAIAVYRELLKYNPGSAFNIVYLIGREYYLAAEQDTLPKDLSEKQEYYKNADSSFAILTKLDSASYIGYIWEARCLSKLDPETTQGLAKPYYEKALSVLLSGNITRNQQWIEECYRYLAYYYFVLGDNKYKTHPADAKANFSKSLEYWGKILQIDPDDAQSKAAIENLRKICK